MATPQSAIATLQLMNGAASGRVYQLDREITIVGRNPDCDIVLAPKSVSRKHASIVRKFAGYELRDLGSTRGTYVDGQKVAQPIFLKDGDTLQIGEALLAFANSLVQIEEGDDQSTVFAAIDVLTQSDKHFPMVKPEVKFRALKLIGQELGGTLNLSEVLERIFNSLFEIFPRAERGFVLLQDTPTGVLLPQIIRSRTGPAGELKISKTVLNRVMNGGQAILCKDLAAEFPDSASLSDSKIRSLMAVPLFDENRAAVGVIQIDTRDGRARFEQDDLDLLAAVANQISVAVQNAQLHKVLLKQREMEQELQFARQVMHSLLPDRPASVPGYEFWAHYEPARHVGGDYYGFIPIAPEPGTDESMAKRWAIAVGDVVGKGMPAALLTAKLSAEVQMCVRGKLHPDRVVDQLNRPFDGGGILDMYITFILVVLDVETHRLTVVNAGHPCPLIRRRDGRLEEFGRAESGLPLGIMPDYAYESVETTLEPGETVILYTDGVTDAMDAKGERLGDAKLRDALLAARPGAAAAGDEVVHLIQRHVAERPQFDDITLVCLARNP
jgi:serine phosphatase RsbU (regulator of sigma subunit)/pSer/pThr/pTyr-binding forkhead associated (FHA) protein